MRSVDSLMYIHSFDLSDDEAALFITGVELQFTEDWMEEQEVEVWQRMNLTTGTSLTLREIPIQTDAYSHRVQMSTLARISPDGLWCVALNHTHLTLFYGETQRFPGESMVLEHPLGGGGMLQDSHDTELAQKNLIAFLPDGRWLIVWSIVAGELLSIDLAEPAIRYRHPIPPEKDDRWCFIFPSDEVLQIEHSEAQHHFSLPDLQPISTRSLYFSSRYPALDMARTRDGLMVTFSPCSQPWYDREDGWDTRYGEFLCRVEEAGLTSFELYEELDLSTPQNWDLRATPHRVDALYRDPKNRENLIWLTFPAACAEVIALECSADAFRIGPTGERVWVGVNGKLVCIEQGPPTSALEGLLRRIYHLASVGNFFTWEKLCGLLVQLDDPEIRRKTIAAIAPTLETWELHHRQPEISWAPDDERLALTPIRRISAGSWQKDSQTGLRDAYALMNLHEEGAYFLFHSDSRLTSQGQYDRFHSASLFHVNNEQFNVRLTEFRASRPDIQFKGGQVLISPDDSVIVASLDHVDPLHNPTSKTISTIGGGRRVFVWRDRVLSATFEDLFQEVEDKEDDRCHCRIATSADFSSLYLWMFGEGTLRHIDLITGATRACISWPRLTSLDVSPDGSMLAVGDYPNTQILDAHTLSTLYTLDASASAVCFDPSGEHLIMVQVGAQRAALRHGESVLQLRIHPLTSNQTTEVLHESFKVCNGVLQIHLIRRAEDVVLFYSVDTRPNTHVGFISLPSRQHITQRLSFHDFVNPSRNGEEILYRDTRPAFYRWRPGGYL